LEKIFFDSQGRSHGISFRIIVLLCPNPPIQKAAGQVSFTSDIWSDQNRRPYLALTGHWIAKENETNALKLKSALLAFHRVLGKHDGVTLGDTIIQLLDRAGVTRKARMLLHV
jgi:hypothetical protein